MVFNLERSIKLNLPIDFKEKMLSLLGDEANDFFDSYTEKRASGLRINTNKLDANNWEQISPFSIENIPFVPTGYYFNEKEDQPGKHPYHSAGLFYIQEPSAMFVGEQLDVKAGDHVLDLCAAPGGKSTHIATRIGENGFLMSNEIHPKRAKALSENIERFGLANTVVTNETPERLSKLYPNYFDKILVDAPCSGEGMFRKDPEAMKYWSQQHVEQCANKQREILSYAYKMLKPGGTLVYSTCTFSPEENEQTIEAFVQEFPDMDIIPIHHSHGIQPGKIEWTKNQLKDIVHTARLWPHRLRGEGHFVAKLRKQSRLEEANESIQLQAATKLSKVQERDWNDFKQNNLIHFNTDGKAFFVFKDQLFLLPRQCPQLKGVHLVRAGLHLGVFKKNRFEPNHALALALSIKQGKHVHDLSSKNEEWLRYLRGETLKTTGNHRGWVLITIDQFPLGWSKEANGILKNFYPKGLRLLS